jgi:hypothetical protein
MTYALSWPLQQAILATLASDPGVVDVLGDRVYDAAPQVSGALASQVHATLGDEEARDWSTASDRGARHVVSITVHAPASGFAQAKRAAGAICDALLDVPLTLTRGHVVSVGFVDARTRRSQGDALRQIRLRFAVLAEDAA